MGIEYTRHQVSLLVKFAAFLNPTLAGKLKLSSQQLRLMSCGRMNPTPAVLKYFHLETREDRFAWTAK